MEIFKLKFIWPELFKFMSLMNCPNLSSMVPLEKVFKSISFDSLSQQIANKRSDFDLKTFLISSSCSVPSSPPSLSVPPWLDSPNSRYESLKVLSEKHVLPLCSHWHSRCLHRHLIDSEWWFTKVPKSCVGFSWICSLVGHSLIQNEFRWLKLEQCHSTGTLSHLNRLRWCHVQESADQQPAEKNHRPKLGGLENAENPTLHKSYLRIFRLVGPTCVDDSVVGIVVVADPDFVVDFIVEVVASDVVLVVDELVAIVDCIVGA